MLPTLPAKTRHYIQANKKIRILEKILFLVEKAQKTCEFVNNVRKPFIDAGLQRFHFCECLVNVCEYSQKQAKNSRFKAILSEKNGKFKEVDD